MSRQRARTIGATATAATAATFATFAMASLVAAAPPESATAKLAHLATADVPHGARSAAFDAHGATRLADHGWFRDGRHVVSGYESRPRHVI